MINIGMIGMSDGNAHPYSWSSIINGIFDADEICAAGYPAVADYLKANSDTLGIGGASVTHIWCQDVQIAESIARSAHIPNVVEQLEALIGVVDAVILGRDDPEQHRQMAAPFLEAGIPIFIDKPLAVSREDLQWFSRQHREGKWFMSCSSMRYANECRTAKTGLNKLGTIQLVTAVGKKDWNKYGVHMVEALFALLDDPEPESVRYVGEADKDLVIIKFKGGLQATLHLFMNISPTFQLTVFGAENWALVDIRNSYSMFRDTIIEFIRSVQEEAPRLAFEKTYQIVNTVVAALESKENGGQTIDLTKLS